jgi:hypothetical protein
MRIQLAAVSVPGSAWAAASAQKVPCTFGNLRLLEIGGAFGVSWALGHGVFACEVDRAVGGECSERKLMSLMGASAA